MKLFGFFTISFLFMAVANASMSLEFTGYGNTDSFTNATTSTGSRTYFSGDFLFSVSSNAHDAHLYVGLHANQLLIDDRTATTTSQLNGTDMGAVVSWIFDLQKVYSVSAGYNFLSTATYNTSTTASTYTGAGYHANFSYAPEIGKDWHLGFRLQYHAAQYTRSTTSTTAADVSYSRTFVFPSVFLAWRN